MERANQLHDMVNVPRIQLWRSHVIAKKRAEAVDAHDTPGLRACSDKFIRNVARVWAQRAGVTVREDDWSLRHRQYVARGAVASVAKANPKPQTLHLPYHFATEASESSILLLTSTTDTIANVIGQ